MLFNSRGSLTPMRALLALLPFVSTTALALAYTVPFPGWSAQDDRTWGADSGVCVLREEKHQQDFTTFASREEAVTFAAKLQKALFAQKLAGVVTQPVERAGQWGVLASYTYTNAGETYSITQLYLSEGGKLRTFTGSSKGGVVDQCVTDMRSFVRYLAN